MPTRRDTSAMSGISLGFSTTSTTLRPSREAKSAVSMYSSSLYPLQTMSASSLSSSAITASSSGLLPASSP